MRTIYKYSLLIIAGLMLIYLAGSNHLPRTIAQTTQPARFSSNIAIQPNEQGKPWINLSAGRELLTTNGMNEASSIPDDAQPLALA